MIKPTLKQLCNKYKRIDKFNFCKQLEFLQFKKDLIKQTTFLNKKKKFKIKMTERMFYILNNKKDIHKCQYCGNIEIKFYTLELGYKSKSCSDKKCRMKKTIKTNLKRYGVTNVYASEEIKKKLKATWMKNLGVLNPYQSEIVKEKIKQTNLKRLGVESPMQSKLVQKKSRKTCLKKYGTKYSLQSEIVKEKGREFFRINYGVENSMQVPHMHEKNQLSSKKFKHYKINKSGTILLLQGYEPKVIDNLLNTYKESEIIVDRNLIPKFMYKTKDNKNHRYFPDIYIPKENLIIEVKSEWTKTLKPEIQELKKKSILKNKFKFKLIVPKNNKELENISLIKTL